MRTEGSYFISRFSSLPNSKVLMTKDTFYIAKHLQPPWIYPYIYYVILYILYVHCLYFETDFFFFLQGNQK